MRIVFEKWRNIHPAQEALWPDLAWRLQVQNCVPTVTCNVRSLGPPSILEPPIAGATVTRHVGSSVAR